MCASLEYETSDEEFFCGEYYIYVNIYIFSGVRICMYITKFVYTCVCV